MLTTSRKFYVTTPIYYVTAEPHIGTAYTTIAADVLARYYRMMGDEVFFLTGTDEHGQKIARAAKEQNLQPQELVDRLAPKYQEVWKSLDITNDYFIRTTDPAHQQSVQALFRKIIEQGDIYKAQYRGWYCNPCERYVLEKDSPEHLCPVCRRPSEFIEEENYFFRLSKYQEQMLRHLEAHPDFIQPTSRYNEILNRVKMGLEDVSVSRAAFTWGVPMPDDPKQSIWVWFDALINYISAIGYPQEPERFQKFWPADIHLIAKDILWFHAVIWPCMLFSAGLPPPKKIYAHGWWTMNATKISKSKGNMIYPREVVARVGVDGLRYFMMREIPFGADGDFSYDALLSRYNNDLGNDLGNLLLRTLTMIEKYFQGLIPKPDINNTESLCREIEALPQPVAKAFEQFQFSLVLEKIWVVIRKTNKYIDDEKPWVLAKSDRERLKKVLYTVAETIRIISFYLFPFIPQSASK
ncbi:MAG: methionine--tRNA ligase, partial [Planctomycetota bacterium]